MKVDLEKWFKDMDKKIDRMPFWKKALQIAFVGGMAAATTDACIKPRNQPPSGDTGITETTPTPVVINIEDMIPVPENFRGSTLSGQIMSMEPWVEAENISLSIKATDALIAAGHRYNIEGGTTYLISTMNLVDSSGNKQDLILGLVLDPFEEGITPTPDPQGNILVPLSAIFFYTESDGLAFVPPGEGLDIAGGRMLPLGYWQDGDKAYLGFGEEGVGAMLPVFEITQDGKLIYHDPYSGLTVEAQRNQFPAAMGKAFYDMIPAPEVREYTPGGIRLEESLAGLNLEISPEANQEAIYDTIVASFVRFLKKEQNTEAWQKVLEAHPEWAHLTNSDPEETRTEAMNEFLRQTGGRIYMNFMGGTGYTREGWVDLNKGIIFKAGEVVSVIPNDHVRIGIRASERTGDVIVTGAGGKVYSEDEQLVYSVLFAPFQVEDIANANDWKDEVAVSLYVAKLVEWQSDQSIVNPAIPHFMEPFTTEPTLFIWGNGNESFWPYLSGFTNSFLASVNK